MNGWLRGLLVTMGAALLAFLAVRSESFQRNLTWARQWATSTRLREVDFALSGTVVPYGQPVPLPIDRWVPLGTSCVGGSELIELLTPLDHPSPNLRVCDAFGHPILVRGLGSPRDAPVDISARAARWATLACGERVTWVDEFEVRSVGSDGEISEPADEMGVSRDLPERDQVVIHRDGIGDDSRASVDNEYDFTEWFFPKAARVAEFMDRFQITHHELGVPRSDDAGRVNWRLDERGALSITELDGMGRAETICGPFFPALMPAMTIR